MDGRTLLFSPLLRDYVDLEFLHGRGKTLKHIRRKLEKAAAGNNPSFRGSVLGLELDRATNRLTVWATFAGEIEPEVVDYDAFKEHVLRDRR